MYELMVSTVTALKINREYLISDKRVLVCLSKSFHYMHNVDLLNLTKACLDRRRIHLGGHWQQAVWAAW
jgi:hypothetical protein